MEKRTFMFELMYKERSEIKSQVACIIHCKTNVSLSITDKHTKLFRLHHQLLKDRCSYCQYHLYNEELFSHHELIKRCTWKYVIMKK